MPLLMAFLLLLGGCGGGGASVGSAIQITSADNFAGAISSLRWDGVEFIDSNDHGRLLQSAVQFDGLSEAINPTEAGASADERESSSVLLSRVTEADHLATVTRMAYWLPYQGRVLSDHILRKDVRISGNVIRYETTFEMAESHFEAQYESLTGYMPLAFSRMWALQDDGSLVELASPGIGKWTEQDKPLIFSTADGSHAMGVLTHDVGVIYGNWDFADCVKWNLMFRVKQPQSVTFTTYLVVGTLEQARSGLVGL
jgi:hypothetical protein